MSYAVGYRKPPREYQFKKGQPSPNPSGRAGRSSGKSGEDEALWNSLKRAGRRKISFTQNGKRIKIPIFEAIVRQTLNDAVLGDKRARELIFRWFEKGILALSDMMGPETLRIVVTGGLPDT